AAVSGDRFASALQLQDHPRRNRAHLIAQDALAAVRAIAPRRALPYRTPRILRYVPLTALAAAAIVFLSANHPTAGRTVSEPEISVDQWKAMHEEFREALADLPKPRTPQERELHERLERLAKSLQEKPQKRDVLEQISRLREEIDRQRRSLPGQSLSMRQAAA